MLDNMGLTGESYKVLKQLREIRGSIVHPKNTLREETIGNGYNAGLPLLRKAIEIRLNGGTEQGLKGDEVKKT